ncbi:hypothetical protein MNBD_GAMMA11-760 [hydrothermal vent metagenome]|uniref:HTH cro/C1-type domain-containing protein n=1 Tax=hydrothermal vent metagenome TaxID=652676 RepID=A0A3B0X0S6_9ZZZZ
MPTPAANINPSILTWARERAQFSPGMLAKKLNIKEDKLDSWKIGEIQPTFKQAQKIAKATHIPSGYLFLPEPPEEELPVADLRTVGNEPLNRPGAELIEVIRQALFRQAWFQDYLKTHAFDQNPVVARKHLDTPVVEIVDDMRNVSGLTRTPFKGNWKDHFKYLIQRIESLNIPVMRSGVISSNTHKPLSVKEFRGFALSDKLASVIFINLTDAPPARLFTLIRELAHVWTGVSGISDTKPDANSREEQTCNSIAAELDNLVPVATKFHISQWVIARRALENKLVSFSDYSRHSHKVIENYKNKKGGGGGNYYLNLKGKVSERFSVAVPGEALDELMDWAKPRKSMFVPVSDLETQNIFAQVSTHVMTLDHMKTGAREEFLNCADPWLVAKAKTLTDEIEITVVTHETFDPHIRKKIKLPDICKYFNIPYINTFDALRKLEAEFVLATA